MLRPLLKHLRAQLFILGVILVLVVLGRLEVIPSPSAIETMMRRLVSKGYLALVVIAAVENVGGLNAYFPGSVAILAGMAATKGDPSLAVRAFLAIACGSSVAHGINFALGRRFRGTIASAVPGSRVYWLSCWHPHFASVAAIAAGQSGVSVRDFVSRFGPAFLCWNVFWGVVMYSFGVPDFGESTMVVVGLVVVLWAAWEARRFFLQRYEGARGVERQR